MKSISITATVLPLKLNGYFFLAQLLAFTLTIYVTFYPKTKLCLCQPIPLEYHQILIQYKN